MNEEITLVHENDEMFPVVEYTDKYGHKRYRGYNINSWSGERGKIHDTKEIPETGVTNGIPWVRYPKYGEALQNDAFIREMVLEDMKKRLK